MKKTSHKIIFFGTDNFSLIALKALVEAGYNIVYVVTKPDSRSGRGQKLTFPAVKTYALERGIAVLQPQKTVDIAEAIISLKEQPVGILASYGKIIPASIIKLFQPGIINIHPSLLPVYRGPTPIESAIENGDAKTGVSIMLLDIGMDSGSIYDQTEYDLSGTETQPQLYDSLGQLGAQRLISILPNILDSSLLSKPQNDTQAVYCNLLSKDNQWLEPTKNSAKKSEQQVRAHLIFPKTKYELLINNTKMQFIITKAHVSDSMASILDIKCADGKYLSIDELIAPSGRRISGKDFLNGYAA
ncbi:methionyl-tRNA formyltransferase [Candidatus Saccharibacteria bacterium]|nr:methionyl-tRNA formyltransferase [Candidatus Saccharibacteria bacterium]